MTGADHRGTSCGAMPRREEFIGRAWALGRVDAWLAAGSPSLVVTGDPGTGKTALAMRVAAISDSRAPANGYSALRPGVIAYAHFCRAQDTAVLDPLGFVRSLAQGLARRCAPYARALLNVGDQQIKIDGHADVEHAESGAHISGVRIENLNIGGLSAAVAFERMVREPLSQLDQVGWRFVVLVDALDEALTLAAEETVVSLVTDVLQSGQLPSSLRFLLTSRRDRRVVDGLPGPRLDLLNDAAADVDDVQRYAETRLAVLGVSQSQKLACVVARHGRGNFLYARYVVDDLLADPPLLDVDGSHLPEGLDEQYRRFLKRELARNDETWAERYRPLLGLLTVARDDGLTAENLAGAANLLRSPSRVNDALRRLGQYLDGPAPDGPFRIYHQSFRDFVASDQEYCVYPDEAERALTDYLIASTPTSADGRVDWPRTSDYARVHLATHAAAVGVLDGLVTDPGYLLAADPDSLLLALPSVASPVARVARTVYRRVFDALRSGRPSERASYLEMAARQAGANHIAEAVAGAVPSRPWSTPWACWQPVDDYFVAGRHEGGVYALAMGELDGRPIALTGGGIDGTVRVWDLTSGTQHGAALAGHSGGVRALAVCQLDGVPIAISGGDDGTLRVWDLASGKQRGEPLANNLDRIRGVAVGKLDGRPVVVSGGGDRTLRVWDLTSGTHCGDPLLGHDSDVMAVRFGEIGGAPIAVSGGDDGTVRVWDLTSSTQRGEPLEGHGGRVWAVAVGEIRGAPIALSGGSDGTVRLWDLHSGAECGQPLVGHDGDVIAVEFAELDGQPIAVTAGLDRTLRVWDLTSRTQRSDRLTNHSMWVTDVAVTKLGGQSVALSAGQEGTLCVWDLASDIRRGEAATGVVGDIRAVAVGELAGEVMALSGGFDGTVRVWDVSSGTQRGVPLAGHVGGVTAVAFGEIDGEVIALSGGYDGTVRLWDMASGTQRGEPLTPRHGGMATMWRSEIFGRSVTLPGRTGGDRVSTIGFGALGGRPVVLTGGHDGTVRIWDLPSGAQRGETFAGPLGLVSAVVATELDGSPIVLSAHFGGVYVWDLTAGTQRCELSCVGSVTALAVGEFDGQPVALTGDDGGTLCVWDLMSGTPRCEIFHGQMGSIEMAALAEVDGQPIAIHGGPDGTLRFWDLRRKRTITLATGSTVRALASAGRSAMIVGANAGLMVISLTDHDGTWVTRPGSEHDNRVD